MEGTYNYDILCDSHGRPVGGDPFDNVSSFGAMHALDKRNEGNSILHRLRIHEGGIRQLNVGQADPVNGDVVFISDVSAHAVIGADLLSHAFTKVGKREGLCELPPGVHFIYGYTIGPNPCRNGFWFVSQKLATGEPGECHVLHWDRFQDALDEQVVRCEKMFQKKDLVKLYYDHLPNVREHFVAAGNVSRGKPVTDTLVDKQSWNDLTFAINGVILNRILRKTGWNDWKDFGDPRYPLGEPAIFERAAVLSGAPELKFASQGRHDDNLRQAMSQRTAIGTTFYAMWESSEDLVCEIQFAYISGVFLLNRKCIVQFMFIVRIVLRARTWSMKEPIVYTQFLRALSAILQHNEMQQQTAESLYDYDTLFREEMKKMLIAYKSHLINGLLAVGAHCNKQHMELNQTFEQLEGWVARTWGCDLLASELEPGERPEFGEYETGGDKVSFRRV